MQRRDDRHTERAEQDQQMTACLAAEDAELVLHGHDIDAVHVQIIGTALIRGGIGLGQLETHTVGIGVTLSGIVDRKHQAIHIGRRPAHGRRQVRRERRDPAVARQVIAENRDPSD